MPMQKKGGNKWRGKKIIGTQKVFLLPVVAHMCPAAKGEGVFEGGEKDMKDLEVGG